MSSDPLFWLNVAIPVLLIVQTFEARRMRRRLTAERDELAFRVESLATERDAQQRLIANLRYRLRILRAAREELARAP